MSDPLPSPRALRDRIQQLAGKHQRIEADARRVRAMLRELEEKIEIADAVDDALDQLSDRLFGRVVQTLEDKLSLALQEVLEQPIQLKAECRYLRGSAAIEFHIERAGAREDILRGQGGSVANVVSVGLRILALTTLDDRQHRRFLVLDEQDCWLRPDLVPRLVKIVYEAAHALGFQVLMISHHNLERFSAFADVVYRFEPSPTGIKVKRL